MSVNCMNQMTVSQIYNHKRTTPNPLPDDTHPETSAQHGEGERDVEGEPGATICMEATDVLLQVWSPKLTRA